MAADSSDISGIIGERTFSDSDVWTWVKIPPRAQPVDRGTGAAS